MELETQEVRERMTEKHWVGPKPQDKGKWPLERDFGAQKNPLVTGGGVRTLGGQGTGSSRPALCVSRREWGTGRDRELGTPASSPATPPPARDAVTFLMSPRYREMKRGRRRKRDPARWPRQRESMSEMRRDGGDPGGREADPERCGPLRDSRPRESLQRARFQGLADRTREHRDHGCQRY